MPDPAPAALNLPDLPLRRRYQHDAHAKARELTAATGLVWQVEWRTATQRWHVVVERRSLRHITPAAVGTRTLLGAPLGTTTPPQRRR